MVKKIINLNGIDSAKTFVKEAERTEFDIDLVSGRYRIDAKSIMGVFSLDLSKNIEMHINNVEEHDADEFLKRIDGFLVK